MVPFQVVKVVMAAGLVSPAVEAEGASVVDIGRGAPSRRLLEELRGDRLSLISVNRV